MTPAERLAGYKRDLAALEVRRAALEDELERLLDAICDKKVEIQECEDAMRVDGDDW